MIQFICKNNKLCSVLQVLCYRHMKVYYNTIKSENGRRTSPFPYFCERSIWDSVALCFEWRGEENVKINKIFPLVNTHVSMHHTTAQFFSVAKPLFYGYYYERVTNIDVNKDTKLFIFSTHLTIDLINISIAKPICCEEFP